MSTHNMPFINIRKENHPKLSKSAWITVDYLKLRTEKNNYFFFFLFEVIEIKMWIKNHCSKF